MVSRIGKPSKSESATHPTSRFCRVSRNARGSSLRADTHCPTACRCEWLPLAIVNHRTNYALPVFCALSAGILGLILALRIPSGVFPEFRFPRAIILADNSGLPREQMLVSVTRPLEEAAYGVPGTSLVRSTTSRGSAEIDVTFTQETDPVVGYQLLNAAIAEVRERLPQATSLNSRLLTTGSFPILDLSLSSKSRSLPDLTDIALYDLIPALRRISGVYRADA